MSSTTDTEHRFAYLLSPEFEIVNTAGKPLTGGWIEVYLHGTRNKYYCFSDFDGTLHPFQIPLDSLGSNIILASPLHAYDVYIYNKFGSLVMSRYNIVPATNSSDAIADIIVIDSPDDTIKVVVDGGTNWHLEVNTDLIATASGLNAVVDELANKKDKQEAKSFTGSVTKTVKNISQDDNGVITVEYEDIDLPPEVPNVNITSPNGTINVTSSTDTSTNTKTFRLDVNSDAINSYYIGKSGSSATMVKGQTVTLPLPLSNMSLKGEDIDPSNGLTASLTDGLYLISYNIHVAQSANSVENSYNEMRIYFGCQNEIVYDFRDASYPDTLDYPYGRTFTGSFVREVAEGADNQAYITIEAPYNGNAYIKEISIVKLNGIFGQSSPRYAPGYGIVIDDDNTISVATGDVITHNYFDIVIDAVTGDIVNINESVTNLIGATGDYATRDYVDEAVSGLENYSAGQYISIEDHTISATGLQPAGNYATAEQLEAVSGDVNNLTEIVNNITNVTGDFATVEYVDNRIATAAGDVYEAGQYISIEDGVIAATGLQPAGNYATEQYVDEAVAAVTGQPISQVQSDWIQQDDTKVDYIKHKPRQVNLVAGDHIAIEQQDLDVIISATGIGDVYNAGQFISIQNGTISATGVQPAGNYLTPADLNGYATEQYVDDAVAAVTGQPISQVNSDWLATSGVAEILNKPDVFQLIAGDNIDITASGNDLVISASSDVTKAYVDERIDAATGMIPDVSDLATKTEVQTVDAKVDAVSAAIPTLPSEEEVEFEELNLSDYALASAIPDISDLATKSELAAVESEIPDISNLATKAEVQAATGMIPSLDGYATEQYVDSVVEPIQAQVNDLIAATGDYLQASDLDGYTTEQDLSDAIDTVTGMIPDISDLATKSELAAVEAEIPDISNLATKTELDAVDAKVDAVSAAIPTLPSEEEVEFEELNLSDYALASAIPDISNLATKTELAAVESEIPVVTGFATKTELQEVEAEIPDISNLATKADVQAATGMIPDISDLATKTEVQTVDAKVDAVSAAIPTLPQEEEVEFEELDLSDYALASAIPDVSDLATKSELSAVEAEIPNVSDLATKSEVQAVDAKIDAVSAEIPETEEIEFEEVDLSDFALASAVVTPVQSDWNVTATGDLAYIKNKPSDDRFVPSTAGIFVGAVLTAGSGGHPVWAIAPGSYFAGAGIDINNHTISVDETVITTAATAVELHKANFEIDNNGQAYKLSSDSEQVTYALTSTSQGGTFTGTVKLNAGDTITVTNCPITDSQVQVYLGDSNDHEFARYVGSVTAGSDITVPVTRDIDLTDTFTVHLFSFTDFQSHSFTDSSCTFDNVTYSREEYALASDVPQVELNSNDQVTAIDGHTLAGGGSNYTAGSGIDITNDIISVDSTVALKSDIPTEEEVTFEELDLSEYALASAIPDVSNLATKSEVQAVEAEIPVVTGFATKSELATVEAEIPTLPTEEEVTFEELDLSDYALASAIPDVTNLATKSEVQAVEVEVQTVSAAIPEEEEIDFEEVDLADYALASAIPDTSDMATQTWVGQQGYLTSVPSTYVTDTELNSAVSGLATKTEVNAKQDTLTGITDVQVVQSLPASPVATVLYLIPEA